MLLIAIGLCVLLVCFFAFVSTKGSGKRKTISEQTGKPNLGRVVTPSSPGQIVPADKMTVQQNADAKTGALDAHDIEKTKSQDANGLGAAGEDASTQKRVNRGGRTLGDVPPFRKPYTDPEHLKNWNPEPYSGSNQAGNGQQAQTDRQEEEEYAKPSVVFMAHETGGARKGGIQLQPEPDNFGFEPGYHLAARLESMASTALRAPVTAVIEYNYERNGKLLIPAGSRVVGKISQADASGTMNIVFDSIEMTGGETTPISAIAATTSLQALKGRVTGKNAGRSFAVRALAGMGEAGAMLVGQGNVNSAVSESDLIRQRAAENIGNGADAQVMGMMLTQHIVVSVPAGTEIYLIFTKAQKVSPSAVQTISAVGEPQ
jgi:type IV secretory pathway VirB10-like protein